MSKPQRICAPHELKAALLDLLRDGTCTSDHLARFSGYSGNAVRERLSDLRVEGYVTRTSEPRSTGGKHYLWSINSAAGQLPAAMPAEREPTGFGKPRQTITSAYPKLDRRDPLVSALFGPAHKEAA